MAITVRRLTRIGDLGLSLVAGLDGADRVIDWAHAIELVDPTPWLSGGELVMTTGLKIGTSADEQYDYVSSLVQAGAAALAFDTGTTFERVPDGIRRAGDALGLSILSVPASTPFIAITRAVIDELTADQVRSVQRVVDQQETFARATLRGGIPAVISALGRALSSSVAVIDTDQRILAVHGADSAHAVTLARSVAEAAGSGSSRRRPTSKVIAGDHGYCTIQSISAAQDLHGYLAVTSRGPLAPSDRLLVAHAVSLISIELSKPAKVVDAEHRLRAAVTQALLAFGEHVDVSLLRFFGFEPETQVAAVILTDLGPLLAAERHTTNVLGADGTPYLMTPTESGIVVIVPAQASTEIGARLHQQVGAQLQRSIGGGLGLPATVFAATRSVKQAAVAARAGGLQDKKFVDFAELGTFSLLLGSPSTEELRAISHSMLGVLDDYDDAHSPTSGLVATVAAFLEHNGQTEVAAAALGIHRHTMRNRLNKVVELTGRDLDSAHVRAELWIAVTARELLGTLDDPR